MSESVSQRHLACYTDFRGFCDITTGHKIFPIQEVMGMRCLRVTNQAGDSCTFPCDTKNDKENKYAQLSQEGLLEDLVIDGEVGDSYEFTLIEITEEEFDELPEFMGW